MFATVKRTSLLRRCATESFIQLVPGCSIKQETRKNLLSEKKLFEQFETFWFHFDNLKHSLFSCLYIGKVGAKAFLLLLLVWAAEFSGNGYANRIGPYLSVLGRSRCAC
jgi:hypothetical protein